MENYEDEWECTNEHCAHNGTNKHGGSFDGQCCASYKKRKLIATDDHGGMRCLIFKREGD